MINKQTETYVKKLSSDPNNLCIILFGSWARGDNRDDSDVDLVVIVKEGYARAVEIFEGQVFEIIYVTLDKAIKHWRSHPDSAYYLWDVAQVLYDKENIEKNIRGELESMFSLGKKGIPEERLSQVIFDAKDQVNAAKQLTAEDPATASLILNNTLYDLTAKFFDIRKLWTPPPKQRLKSIRKQNPQIYELITRFYQSETNLAQKIDLANEIIKIVFHEN